MIHPVQSATIHAAVAHAVVPLRKSLSNDDRIEMVDSMTKAAEAAGYSEVGDEHNCPLCHEYFTYFQLVAHAQECIRLRAPRWERNRDREPTYTKVKQYRPTLFGPGGRHDR